MIKLLVLDVDGTMTDGKIVLSRNGDEMKSFHVKDGLAIASWKRMGREVAIITGRRSAIVEYRAKELGIEHYYQGVSDKAEVFDRLVEILGIDPSETAVIGDDLNDLAMLKKAGLSFVPRDASIHIESYADVVLSKKGGEGAVREMIEYVIAKEGLSEEFLALWE